MGPVPRTAGTRAGSTSSTVHTISAGLRADFGDTTASSSRGAGPDCCSGCGGGPVAVACATRRADGASGIGPADPAYHRRVEDVPGAGEGALVVAVPRLPEQIGGQGVVGGVHPVDVLPA